MTLRNLMIIGLSVLLTLSGCTKNAYTDENQVAKTGTGAVIGSIVGAGVGALSSSKSDRKKGMLIGAVSGATIGGGIGLYMDNQEAKLREKLRGTGVSVTRNGDDIILNMPNNITFDTNSAVLKARGTETLMSIALVVKEFDKTRINITGHTDSTGSVTTNERLSLARADSVASLLVSHNIATTRMYIRNAAATQPIASNSTAEGRAANRRVEITLSPL